MKRLCLVSVSLLLLVANLFAAAQPEGKQPLIFIPGGFAENHLTGKGLEKPGRDLKAEFEKKEGIQVTFAPASTGGTGGHQTRLFQIGSLPKTEEDIIMVLHSMADDRIATLMEPLNKYLSEKPIQGYPDDYSKGMLETYTKKGLLYALPARAGVWCLFYNKRIFNERGISGPPQTPEELFEVAKKATYTKPNGEKVYGYATRGGRWDHHEQLAILARMYGGDLITPDYKIVVNQPPVIKGLAIYRKMYQEGIMPPNWDSTLDSATYMRQGRCAISAGGHTDGIGYNSTTQSVEAGNVFAAPFPLAKELQTPTRKISDSMSFMWAFGIFKGSDQKNAAWDLIRFLSQPDSAIETTKNGNAPARISALEYQAKEYDGARVAVDVFKITRPALPPLENANEIIDRIGERMENVVLKGLDAQSEMDQLAKEIAALLK
jgi:multiple sugar transport system substrate-binding protein